MKLQYSVFLIVLCLFLSSCSYKESKGVPDEIIREDIEREFNDYTGCEIIISIQKHDMNTDTHRDTVYATAVMEYKYYTSQYSFINVYEYNKSTDLWTQLEDKSSSNWLISSYTDSIMHTEWTGTCQPPFRPVTKYTIYVDGIDYIDGTIHCTYTLENEDFTKSGEAWMTSAYQIDSFYTIYCDYNTGLGVY